MSVFTRDALLTFAVMHSINHDFDYTDDDRLQEQVIEQVAQYGITRGLLQDYCTHHNLKSKCNATNTRMKRAFLSSLRNIHRYSDVYYLLKGVDLYPTKQARYRRRNVIDISSESSDRNDNDDSDSNDDLQEMTPLALKMKSVKMGLPVQDSLKHDITKEELIKLIEGKSDEKFYKNLESKDMAELQVLADHINIGYERLPRDELIEKIKAAKRKSDHKLLDLDSKNLVDLVLMAAKLNIKHDLITQVASGRNIKNNAKTKRELIQLIRKQHGAKLYEFENEVGDEIGEYPLETCFSAEDLSNNTTVVTKYLSIDDRNFVFFTRDTGGKVSSAMCYNKSMLQRAIDRSEKEGPVIINMPHKEKFHITKEAAKRICKSTCQYVSVKKQAKSDMAIVRCRKLPIFRPLELPARPKTGETGEAKTAKVHDDDLWGKFRNVKR